MKTLLRRFALRSSVLWSSHPARVHQSTSRAFLAAALVTLAAGALMTPGVQAQVARVATVQRVTEKSAGGGAWQKAGVGIGLAINDRFRTGKRSKADLKFTDGSLLRLGQLSSVEVRSAKGVALLGGKLLFSALQPGRVLAGTGAAEIKGSVGIIELMQDGSADFTLYSGAMDVVTPQSTVSLSPGRSVTARADGVLSQIRLAAPLQFTDGTLAPDLLDEPEDTPYAGSTVHEATRRSPRRVILDENIPRTSPITDNDDPFTPGGGGGGSGPFPTPFPTIMPPQPQPTTPNTSQIARGNSLRLDETLYASQVADNADPVTDLAQNDLDLRGALNHFDEVDRASGRQYGGDFALLGAIGDAGAYAYGARLHGFASQGKLFLDVAALPLRVRPSGSRRTEDFSAFSSAYAAYRERRFTIQAGRQRFIEGPTQASFFGSLVRQGGREIMDGVRVSFKPTRGHKAEVAYLYDAFPRNLPFRIGGAQHALYGRYSVQSRAVNLGLNLFQYTDSGVPDTLGATLDFAVPLARDQVELYGEVGRDSFRRRLTSVGLTFPGLYQRTDFDVFLEYANLGDAAAVAAPPDEVTLRVYRRFGDAVNLVASLSHFSASAGTSRDLSFALGISVGARSRHGGGSGEF